MGELAEATVETKTTESTQQNVEFSDQMQPYVYDAGSKGDPTRSLQDTSDATLENFFSRPIKIHEEEWGTGLSLYFNINPWTLYFENPRVINRLINYKLLKANLHVKIVINGNGFLYGRAIASYLPMHNDDNLTTNRSLIPQDIIGCSQRPHIYLDPTTSSGGEMVLPMFWRYNYLDICTSEWQDLGELNVRSINDLLHANGAADKVTVSVFAWAEDVSMSVLTSREPSTLVPQMGETNEANRTGMISKPASVVAKCAGALKTVPAIAPFAIATEMGASAVGNIAKLFGYSRPVITKAPDPFIPRNTGSFANTNVPDHPLKLTVDDMQELTIDPRISGLDDDSDPMNIKSIAQRESYLTSFSWTLGTTPETMLWNARIDPVIWDQVAGPPLEYHLPACAMAALPFKYWTGTMRFRFQVVCSTFHKGRLKFVYDPDFLASNEYNTNYLHVVDISDTKDFTIEVGNGQNYTLIDHHLPGPDSVTQMFSTTPYASKEEGNGVLGVYIVNELTTPDSTATNDVQINVFVSMGDDFEVFVPDEFFQHYTFAPQMGFIMEEQSGRIVPESENTNEPSAPIHNSAISLGPRPAQNDLVNKVYTGEAITSFRQMLKRYSLWSAFGIEYSASFNTMHFQLQLDRFPFLRGGVTGAIHSRTGPVAYNFCNTLLLHWVRNSFSGFRGSIRYKFAQRASRQAYSEHLAQMQVNLVHAADGYAYNTQTPVNYSSLSEAAASVLPANPVGKSFLNGKPNSLATGGAVMFSTVNPVLEFEVPYYSNKRFQAGKPQDYTSNFEDESFVFQAWPAADNSATYDIYAAGGEDIQAYFFTGTPRLFYEATPPTPIP